MSVAAVRGRGLGTHVLPDAVLAELELAPDAVALAAVLARAGLPGIVGATALDRLARDRVAADLAILARWTSALAIVELDEDRRSLRAIARGLVAHVSSERRLAGTVPTRRLPAKLLAALADAGTAAELGVLLARAKHPFAPIFAAARPPLDLLELELALAKRFAALARTRDRALRSYVAQVIDAENAAAALALAERGADLRAEATLIAGGRLVPHAIPGTVDAVRAKLARVLAGTPLARALYSAAPSALEDATLAWQLATQARLRRIEPLGLAPALYTLLRRRDEARRLRRAAWRLALRGAA